MKRMSGLQPSFWWCRSIFHIASLVRSFLFREVVASLAGSISWWFNFQGAQGWSPFHRYPARSAVFYPLTNQLGNFYEFERKNFREFFCELLYYLIGNFSGKNKKNFEGNFLGPFLLTNWKLFRDFGKVIWKNPSTFQKPFYLLYWCPDFEGVFDEKWDFYKKGFPAQLTESSRETFRFQLWDFLLNSS